MAEVATLLLVLLLGGGALLVLLVVGLVSGGGLRSRLNALEQELGSHRVGMLELHKRVGFLEAELAKARSAVALLWTALDAAQRALPAAEKKPAAPQPAPAPVEAMTAVEPRRVGAALAPPGPALEVPVAARSPLVEAPAAAAIAPVELPVAAPPVETPPQVVDTSIPEPSGWKSPPLPAPVPVAAEASPPRARPFADAEPPHPASDEAPADRPRGAPPPEEAAGVPARIDWERWVGVRGAAALGAGVLVLAGLYFFKYSIENGLISPSLRVALGTLAGLGCLGGSERTRRRETPTLANWLAGAGVAILYLAFWAAHAMYGLIGMPLAFGLMALVTIACGALSVRHGAMVIALLGLAGGFSTPLALSSGSDHPVGLFGYLLLLDVALLYLAHKRSWPLLGALSLAGTFLYQVGWVGVRMGPDRLFLGMGIVLVFGGVFAAAAPRPAAGDSKKSDLGALTRAASTLLPFGFGLYFGLRSDLGEHLYPLGLMLALLGAGAAWVARAHRTPWMSLAAAVAGVTVLGTWLVRHDAAAIPWEVTGFFVLFGAIFHGFLELERQRPTSPKADAAGISRTAGAASLGPLVLLIFAAAAPSSLSPWPWMAGWVLLAAFALRHAGFEGRAPLHLAVALVLGLGFPLVYAAHLGDLGAAGWPRADHYLGVMIAAAVALQAVALLRRSAAARVWATHGAASATLLAFALALHVGSRAELGEHLYPLLPMLCVLAAGAAWVAREREAGPLSSATALAGLAGIASWLLHHDAAPVAIEVAAIVGLFAAVFHGFVELQQASPRDRGAAGSSAGAAIASLGALILLVLTAASGTCVTLWPWLAGWIFLAALTVRHAGFEGGARLHLGVGIILGLGLPLVHAAHQDYADTLLHGEGSVAAASSAAMPPGPAVWLGLALGAAIALQVVAQVRQGEARRWASHGGGVLALLLLLEALVVSPSPSPALVLLTTGLLGLLALVTATRLGSGGWALAATLATALLDTLWALREVDRTPAVATVALAGQAVAVALFVAWPPVARARFREDRWAWRAAALAGPAWFGSLYFCWSVAFGKGAIGLLPLLLAAGSLGAAADAHSAWEAASPIRRSALAWLLGVAVAFVSLAVPLQLQNEWITVGWALLGVALLALWKRLDHAGLKLIGLAHLAVVTVRLVANPWVLEYHPRASTPIFNWLAYTYWIPALSLIGAWALLRGLEVSRLRPWEVALHRGRAVGALASAASAVGVIFLWINLTIVDAFSTDTELHLFVERLPARDLTLSITWAVYALILLAIGMVRGSAVLRWTSLALIIVTLGKAFLYDLAHLHDLYRVASLVGLALSLILISLAYQRFVFGKRKREGA